MLDDRDVRAAAEAQLSTGSYELTFADRSQAVGVAWARVSIGGGGRLCAVGTLRGITGRETEHADRVS